MISIDILLTAVIVAAAAVWAGRSLWKWLHRRSGGGAAAPNCGGPSGSCGSCPAGETDAVASPDDAATCGEDRPDES